MSVKWWHGWGPLILSPILVIGIVPANAPRWAFMWILAAAVFGACKWLTWRRTPAPRTPKGLHLGYLLAWPGMDARAFLTHDRQPTGARPTSGEWAFAAAKLIIGVGVLYGIARHVPGDFPYLAGWVGMIGIVMVLHFGTFHLISCAWRAAGIEAKPLMHWPLAATSLGEFWGRRWNTAFRDLTHRFLFRPLTRRVGPRWAIFCGFAASGLIHDLVISFPAGGGHGGPTLFFVVQGLAMFAERSDIGRRVGLARGWPGWMFTAAVLLLPAGLLFHPPFVRQIVLPFLRSLGAI